MNLMVTVDWIDGMVFRGKTPSGATLTLDSHPEFGGTGAGPTPVEALLTAAAACSGMDVLAILRKKQQKVSAYRIEIDGTRGPEGQFPRPFLTMTVRHIVEGEEIDPAAVQRAVELSDEKYCTVLATLRGAPAIASEYRIIEPD